MIFNSKSISCVRRCCSNLLNKCTRTGIHIPRRNLNVHEYVSYTLLKEAGIPVPKFGVAKTKEEVGPIAKSLGTNDLVVKAQVLAGGRGKGSFKGGLRGGVKVVNSPQEAEQVASKMLGDILVTKQTGSIGKICNSVMITERKYPKREFYFAITMERAFGGPVVIASSEGGVSIEDVAAENPEAIVYQPIDIVDGLSKKAAEEVADKVGLKDHAAVISDMLLKLYGILIKKDAGLVEINPFIEDNNGQFFSLDAKLKFDDNAEFRQKEVFAYRDFTQEDTREVEASKFNLNYITLDGDIGCMVNGAGLAMATLDIINLHGGKPANFLDVGGGANAQQVKSAIQIIISDPNVQVILVNIFGGIMRCDIIAEGIIAAAHDLKLSVPIVCRLQGTNVDEAKVLLAASGMKILPVSNLDKATRLAVKLSNIISSARSVNLDVNFEMPI